MAQSFLFSTDKFVWIDEAGSDARDQARRYGYALLGQTPVVHRFHSRGTNAKNKCKELMQSLPFVPLV